MSLHNLANEIQKKGRGNDKMLMHVTPREVAGLQAIAKSHGGSLTVNPDTGLVEAGFLDNILPMVIGAGLTVASGGALTPLMAAGITGAGYGLATGSVEKGLMAGLGAYGGAGLGAGLTSAGSASIAEAGGANAVNNATSQGLAAMPEGYNAANAGLTQNQMLSGSQDMSKFINAEQFPNLNAEQLQGLKDTAQSGAYNPQDIIRTAGAQNATATTTPWDAFKTGAKETFGSAENASKFVGDNYGKIASAAAPAIASAMQPEPYKEPEKKKYYGYASLSPNFQGYTPPTPNPYYRPTGLGYAAGGLTQMAPGGLAAIQGMRDGYDPMTTTNGDEPQFNGTTGSKVPKPKKATLTGARNIALMDPLDASMAELNNARYGANMSQMAMPKAGLAELGALPYATGGMAQGRYLSGGGDGMSDSIPATINGKQPARLADGEFVIPADVVSHLGNGSSDAGAKKLYSMMDKIRTARTGKKKQAPAVKADKYMPA